MKKTLRTLFLFAGFSSTFAFTGRDASAATATVPGSFTQACATTDGCFKVKNTANQPGIYGVGNIGVQGDGGGLGIWGQGVTGVQGETNTTTSFGVTGLNHGGPTTTPGAGVLGNSPYNFGVEGISVVNTGVFGTTSGAWPAVGVLGENTAANGTAIAGIATQPNSFGIFGQGTSMGVQGFATDTNGIGTSGVASGAGGHAIDAICNSSCASGGGYAGYFTGGVYVTGSMSVGGFINRSDVRLKKDVKELGAGLTRLLKLRPVTYRWRDEANGEGNQIGLIAQEVREIFPELVQEDRTSGMLSVNYTALAPVAIKGLQEQQAVIERLEARLARLERDQRPLLSSLFSDNLAGAALVGLLPIGLMVTLRRRGRRAP